MSGMVLDSSALFYGKDLPAEFELVISPGVAAELERHGMGDRLALLLDSRVKVLSPSKESLARILSTAEASGDSMKLSSTDKEILALALDLGYELITDDYSIQNLASILEIPCRGLDQKGIEKVIEWESKCAGCGKRLPANVKECDVCGSRTKPVGKRKQGR